MKKAGHAGTLDPFATGLLTIAVGRSTRVLRYMENFSKRYRATMFLGKKTETGDPEGEVVGGKMPTEEELLALRENDYRKIKDAVMSFVGEIEQIPSKYSAIKINGRPAYDYARSGQEVEIPVRKVTIDGIDILRIFEEEGTCLVEMEVSCSKGTYIRTLCEDIGEKLGFGAYCTALRRLSCGKYGIDSAFTLEEIEKMQNEGDESFFMDEMTALSDMPSIEVTQQEASDMGNGKKLDFCTFKDRMENIDGIRQGTRVLATFSDRAVAVIYVEDVDGTLIVREERVLD